MPLLDFRTTSTTGTGTTPVALTGFGFKPKACRFRWIGRTGTADGIGRGTADFGWGVACSPDSTSGAADRAVCGHSTDAAGTTACQSGTRDDASIITVSGAGAFVGRAHVSSWDADGITITIDAAFGVDLEFEVVAWGGDCVVAVGNTAAEPAGIGTVDTTNVGFTPDHVAIIGMSQVSGFSSPSQIQANAAIFAGHAVKNPAGTISNGVLASASKNGVTTTVTVNYCRVGECIARYNTTPSTTLDAFAGISAMLSNGFTLNWGRVNATGVTRIFFYLAIKGGFWEIPATITQPTSTATDISVTTNFRPTGAMFFSSSRTAAETQGTATNSVQDNYGSAVRNVAAGTTSEGEMLVRDTNAQAGAVTSTDSNHTHCNATIGNGTLTVEMHTTAFTSTGITCRMTTADATQRRFHALVWGSFPPWVPNADFVARPSPRPPPELVQPLSAIAVAAAVSAWGYEPTAPGGRSSRVAPDGSAGQPLPGAAVGAVTAWGYEPTSPGGRTSQARAPFFGVDQPGAGAPAPSGFELAPAAARAPARPQASSGEATTPGVFTATGYDPAPPVWRPAPRDPKFTTGDPYPPRVFIATGFETAPPSWRQAIAPKFFPAPDRFAAMAMIVLPPFGFEPEPPRTRSPFADRRLVNGEPVPARIAPSVAGYDPALPVRRGDRVAQPVGDQAWLSPIVSVLLETAVAQRRSSRPAVIGAEPIAATPTAVWFNVTPAAARARRPEQPGPASALPIVPVVTMPVGFEASPVLFRVVRARVQVGAEAFSVVVVVPPSIPAWATAMPGHSQTMERLVLTSITTAIKVG